MRAHRRRLVGIKALLIAICIISIMTLSFTSVVKANAQRYTSYKYYTSIDIKSGDTLWSIANEYAADTQLSIAEYIREIKSLNNLSGDNITAGQSIVVFYMSDEYK